MARHSAAAPLHLRILLIIALFTGSVARLASRNGLKAKAPSEQGGEPPPGDAAATAKTLGWHPHCALKNSLNTSLGNFVNKNLVKEFVQSRTPSLRVAKTIAYSTATTGHMNYSLALAGTLTGDDMFFKAAHMTGGVVRLRNGTFHCIKEPCGAPSQPRLERLQKKWGSVAAALMESACDKWMSMVVQGKTLQRFMYRATPRGCVLEEGLKFHAAGMQSWEQHDIRSTPADIKVFCMNGRPVNILYCSRRFTSKHGVRQTFFSIPSMRWLRISEPMYPHVLDDPKTVTLPPFLPRLLEDAARLAQGFANVRVDFLQFGDHDYAFGELTFTHNACREEETWLPPQIEQLYGELTAGQHTALTDRELEARQLEIIRQYHASHEWRCANETGMCGWQCENYSGCKPLDRALRASGPGFRG